MSDHAFPVNGPVELDATGSEHEGGSARLGLVVVSPRVPAGLMTRDAWRRIEDADVRLARSADEPLAEAVREAGLNLELLPGLTPEELATHLVERCAQVDLVWLGSADADPGLTDALANELTRLERPPEVEVIVGSWDAPGSRLLDAVAVMDVLRSPGGCPWDARQTHASLAPYLVEEAFEVAEAVAEQDAVNLEEELGDVLLQVLFHARIASERTDDGFDIDGVAGTLVEKLLRRHPHVFADGEASTAEEVEAQWARIKAAEKPHRDADDVFAGIPAGLPPLERAVKYVARLEKSGRGALVDDAVKEDSVGAALLDIVVQARGLDVDPTVALAATLSAVVDRVAASVDVDGTARD